MTQTTIIESEYPISFREDLARNLGEHLKNRHSLVLIGMKRAGISNFLRFFLYHQDIAKTHIDPNQHHLFVPVDLNDLVEREIFPFWMLTLKRIVDNAQKSDLKKDTKEDLETLFLDSIQSKSLFLVIDSVHRGLTKIIEAGFLPTLFFLRFDRIIDASTEEFLANLEGLRDATHNQLAYVFTSYKNLNLLSPVFADTPLSLSSHKIYVQPAKAEDINIIFDSFMHRFDISLSIEAEKALFEIVDGYVQYLQLALITLHQQPNSIKTKAELLDLLYSDERITMQSEELWNSLDHIEQAVLTKLIRSQDISVAEKDQAKYLWETGFVKEVSGKLTVFSPLFRLFVENHGKKDLDSNRLVEFSKKELSLFNFLQKNLDQICEREAIIEAVWPEEEDLGVSDWAIDRLIARLRSKLKKQESLFEIITVKTRGYKLISSTS